MIKRGVTRLNKPLVLGNYTLTATGIAVKKGSSPTFAEHEGVGEFIQRAHKASGFWLADWMRYGESRKDWAKRLDQAVDATGLSAKTLKNVRAVGAIDPSRRRDDVDFGLHEAVAGLPAADQTHWLEKAATGGWTVRDLRHAIQRGRRTTILEGSSDRMFDIEVVVAITVEAQSPHRAESKAWEVVKMALAQEVDRGVISKSSAKVIAAHVRPE